MISANQTALRLEADMMEITVFLSVLFAFSFFDIRAMAKAKLKKEILSYLVLSAIAGSLGFVYFTNPFRDSLANIILDIFGILR